MGKRFALLLGLIVLMGVVVLSAGCGQPKAAETIKIGVQGPLSGDYAYEGQNFVKAITLLADQINSSGGLLGKQIQIIQADDKGDPREAALAAQNLVSQGVIAVVGGYNSSATEPASAIYNENHVLQITPSSTATQLSEHGYPLFFRTCNLDDKQGLFAANFIVDTLKKTNVAVIHDNSTYAKGLADWTKKYLEDKGAKVVYFDAIDPKSQDYSATVTKLKGINPDVIYFTGYYSQAGLLLKQLRDGGVKAQFMAGDAVNNPEFVKAAGLSYAQGTIVTTEPLPQDLPYPEAKQFMNDFQAKYGQAPASIWTVMAADAFRVIVEAIKQTGSTDPVKLGDYLHNQLKDFPGLTGPISFDEKGDRTGSTHMAYVVDAQGNFVPYSGK